jgi:hypothetical protein
VKSPLDRWGLLALSAVVVMGFAAIPTGIKTLAANAPLFAAWSDAGRQYVLLPDAVPYTLLRAADERLAADATVLLLTSGEDARHLEYATYHRALYFLTPRPVWWQSPAPSDGTWEARWWIRAPLTADAVEATAARLGADCLLVVGVVLPAAAGAPVLSSSGGSVIERPGASRPCLAAEPRPSLTQASGLRPVRLAAAAGVVLLAGLVVVGVATLGGFRPTRVERLGLSWLLGSGMIPWLSFGLDRLGVALNDQRVVLTAAAVVGLALLLRPGRGRQSAARRAGPATRSHRLLFIALGSLLAFQIVFVALLSTGRPLAVWDSWANWGSKARTIFLEDGVTPAAISDPSRAVTLLDYPLSVPLLEALLYGWLGAADDRLVGSLSLLTYLALLGVIYGVLARWRAGRLVALTAAVAVASTTHLANLFAFVFPDAPLAAMTTVAAVYLLEWLAGGAAGVLLAAVMAAGLLPWIKREGAVLLAALLASALLVTLATAAGRRAIRRLAPYVLGALGAAALLAGPWWLFAANHALPNGAFLPLTLPTLAARLHRLPVTVGLLGRSLLGRDFNLVWPMVAVTALVVAWPATRRAGRAGSLCLLLPAAAATYLGMMTLTYLFSAYVPYQQHVLASAYRLGSDVLPLVVLWWACLAGARPAAGDSSAMGHDAAI